MGGESRAHRVVRTISGALMIGSLLAIAYAFSVPWYEVISPSSPTVFSLNSFTSGSWHGTFVTGYDFFPWESVADLMVIIKTLLLLLLALAVVSILGLLEDDSASGILGTLLFLLLGAGTVVYFALTMAGRIPSETLMWETDIKGFVGSNETGWRWGPRIGWYLVILAMALRASSELLRAKVLPFVDKRDLLE